MSVKTPFPSITLFFLIFVNHKLFTINALHSCTPNVDVPSSESVKITMIGIVTARLTQRPIITPSIRRFLSAWARNDLVEMEDLSIVQYTCNSESSTSDSGLGIE